MTFTDLFGPSLDVKRVEPVKRKHGLRVATWQIHRFPIKNGISVKEAMMRNLFEMNSLYQRIRKLEEKRAATRIICEERISQ